MSSSAGGGPVPQPSDDGRARLAAELDDDIDAFIESLAGNKARPADEKAFDFDEWCDEIDRHPFFMRELPEGRTDAAVDALRALKDDDAQGDAEYARARGNKFFRFAKYRDAVAVYTEGLRASGCSGRQASLLFANRAAAQARLSNWRSALADCAAALRLDVTHAKAALRGAECLLRLGKGGECLRWLDACSLHSHLDGDQVARLRKEANDCIETKKLVEREERQKAAAASLERVRLYKALRRRNVKFEPKPLPDNADAFDPADLRVDLPQTAGHIVRVHLDDDEGAPDDALLWPVLFVYPDGGESDFVKEFPEDCTFAEQLRTVLAEPPAWDARAQYTVDAVAVCYGVLTHRDGDETERVSVPLDRRLRDVIGSVDFVVYGGLPVFYVTLR